MTSVDVPFISHLQQCNEELVKELRRVTAELAQVRKENEELRIKIALYDEDPATFAEAVARVWAWQAEREAEAAR